MPWPRIIPGPIIMPGPIQPGPPPGCASAGAVNTQLSAAAAINRRHNLTATSFASLEEACVVRDSVVFDTDQVVPNSLNRRPSVSVVQHWDVIHTASGGPCLEGNRLGQSQLIHRKAKHLRLGNDGMFKQWRSESMPTNIGAIDRVARFAIGLALIAYAIPIGFAPTGWNWVGWICVIPLLTAAFGFCPLYTMLGMSTCPTKRAS
jgi:Inner membrane protein YgaP-like, transmembrane domain